MGDSYYSNMDQKEYVNMMFTGYLNDLKVSNKILNYEPTNKPAIFIDKNQTNNVEGLDTYIQDVLVRKMVYGEIIDFTIRLKWQNDVVTHNYIIPEKTVETPTNNILEQLENRVKLAEENTKRQEELLDKLFLHLMGYVQIDTKIVDERLEKILG